MTSTEPELPIQYHGKVLRADGAPVGTCFQVTKGVLVTAFHVVKQASSGELGARVLFQPLASPTTAERHIAIIERVDKEQDLAVLRSDHSLPASASHLSLSSGQEHRTQFFLMGFASLSEGPDTATFDYLPANGIWEGMTQKTSAPIAARGHADGVEPGMSGCPVLRATDNAIIGVLHGRYNSSDQWSRGRVWIIPIEALLPLLDGIATVPVDIGRGPRSSATNWLGQTDLDRNRLHSNDLFLQPEEWTRPWSRGAEAIRRGEILVVAAPPGVGSTTFAEQLLDKSVSNRIRIVRLDPGEWNEPSIRSIPRSPWHAYILDLRDPVHDLPSSDFVEGLSSLATWLKSMQSRIVITIRESLWRGWEAKQMLDICTVRLDTSPNSIALIQQYVRVQAPLLLPVTEDTSILKHLDGMNAVQAVEAAERIIRLSDTIENGDLKSATERAREILDNHHEELDDLFADPTRPIFDSSQKPPDRMPLVLQDRCLLIALSCRRTAQLRQLENDSRGLEQLLHDSSTKTITAPRLEPHAELAGPGLRGRIGRISAHVSQNESVTFKRANFADAVLGYVWDNYSAVRSPLAKWLIQLAREGDLTQDATSEWLSSLVQRHQDVDFIRNELSEISNSQNEKEILSSVLYNSVVDPHMQRRCERVLYDWARRPDLQAVVVKVCSRLLLADPPTRPLIALRRLQRVADAEKTSTEMKRAVAEAFSKTASDTAVWPTFIERARIWFRDAPRSTSTRLAFAATLPISVDGVPWILSTEARNDRVDRILSEALSEPLIYGAVTTLVRQLHGNRILYEQFMDLLARAAAGGSTGAAFKFAGQLQTVGEITGYNPVADLYARLQLTPLPTSPHREAPLN